MTHQDSERIANAIKILKEGGVIAYPSDTIPGLGCLPDQQQALQRISNIKKRCSSKAYILLGSKWSQFSPFVAEDWLIWLSKQETTTPTTWVVPCKRRTLSLLTAEFETIAVRLVRHPVVEKLCRACGVITSTSINLSGQETIVDLENLPQHFVEEVDLILNTTENHQCFESGKGSRIIDAQSGNLIRE